MNEPNPSTPAPPGPWTRPAPRPPEVAYHGRLGEVWRLAIVTFALTIVTFGIYRFWAKARIRGYFWSRITVNGEPLEYTGTGLELFLGFLIVLVILIPLGGLGSLAPLLLGDTPGALIAAQLATYGFIVALIPIAIFRARRYRLSRTVWRGVRAAQSGSAKTYWLLAVLYGGLGWVTFGLLRPLAHVRLTDYLMNHTWFGTGRFAFSASVRDLMGRWLLVWVLGALTYVPLLASSLLPIALSPTPPWGAENTPPWLQDLIAVVADRPEVVLIGFGVAGVAALGWATAYVSYRVYMARLFAEATTFEDARFRSGLRFWRVVGVFAVFALTAGGLFFGASAIGFLTGPLAPFFFVAAFFLAGTLVLPFVRHPLLAHYIETLTVGGTVDLEAMAQNAAAAPRFGEGLASAFDVDAM